MYYELFYDTDWFALRMDFSAMNFRIYKLIDHQHKLHVNVN